MTSRTLQDFLKSQGNSFDVRRDGTRVEIVFSDRSAVFCAYPDEDDEAFLDLSIDVDVSQRHLDTSATDALCTDIGRRLKVVKALPMSDGEKAFLRIKAEQFVGRASLADVFWRTVDLLRDVSSEISSADATSAAADEGLSEEEERAVFLTDLETMLRGGCAEGADEPVEPLRESLAFVEDGSGSTATAVCVRSTDDDSFFLTNAHVVGEHEAVTVYLQCPEYRKLVGVVVATASADDGDLALIRVALPKVAAVTLADRAPRAGLPIANLGYPQVQMWAAKATGELYPASHLGTVTSVNRKGSQILYDAISRPGNSGGPLFDPATGIVYGLCCGGWEDDEESVAIGAPMIRRFLESAIGTS